ncbi:MAG: polysaccharide biosynthesis C-terminal domain-containing protein, partial [Lachnospiraceae bacterium]|nr:polysaccharide biosynthesis C-terminal domain-containing protein [Lachnospiraceae bacterium]
VLTGMAYPFILFPSAVIQSMAVMLLPDMAQSQSAGNQDRIDITTTRTITVSLYLGILCTGLFLFYGDAMGERLFSSALAGSYIVTLSWLCPFLYLSTTLGSILNGLGQTRSTFGHSILSLAAQLLFVVFLVPVIGIRGYLYGLLFGQLLLTVLHLWTVRRLVHVRYRVAHHLLRPMGALGLAAFSSKKITEILLIPMISHSIVQLCISCTLLAGIYGCLLLASRNHL